MCVEGEDKENEATHAASDVEPQEEEVPPAEAEQRKFPLHQSNGPGEVVGNWEPTGSQYDWDEEGNEEEDTSYCAYEVGSPELGYLKLTQIARIWYVTPMPSPMSEHQLSCNHCPPPKVVQDTNSARRVAQVNSSGLNNGTHHCVGAKTDGKQPLYDHRVRRCMMTWLPCSWDSSQTLSSFWEVNGTCAHCLLDSGCEGVMVSPNFACAMGMKLTKLEQPIGLQLACVGSKSTINYGTEATIVFGSTHVKEYLNVANIDYYDIIPGTPFLRRLGVALDFTGPGMI